MPDKNTFLAALAYALITGAFNLLLGHKSQVEAWAESNPGIAAVLKFTRAIGLDPWGIIAALSLTFQKKLPEAQKADSAIAMRETVKAEAKANKKDPPDDPGSPVSLMPDPVREVAQDRSRLHNDRPDEPAELSDKWRAPDWRLQTTFGVLLACVLGCSSLPLTSKRCDFTNPEYSAHVAKCRHDIEATCLLDEDNRPRKDCPALVVCQEWRTKECQ